MAIEPDVTTFSTALSTCSRASAWAHSLSLVEEMRCRGWDLDRFSLNAAIGAASLGFFWESALHLLGLSLHPLIINHRAALFGLAAACAADLNEHGAKTVTT